MKVILAPDSFKGSLTAREVADALADGLQRAAPSCTVTLVPVADGGEGFCEAIRAAQGGKWIPVDTVDPLGRPIRARYARCGESAVVETAAASGLPLLRPEERNPLLTSSYGTGLLIRDALLRGSRKLLIGLGGSATHDAGTGLLSALGFRFLDASGQELPGCGASLDRIARIDRSDVLTALLDAGITAACDVDTPFSGPGGAAEVFAPQKGATPDQVRLLDAGTASFAEVIRKEILRCAQDDKRIVENDIIISGAGAAGGIGGALHALLGARLASGIDLVLDAAGFDALLAGADLVITGEGRLDGQTARGKAAAGILRRAQQQGVPVAAVCGRVAPGPALPFREIVALADESIPDRIAMQPDWARGRIADAAASIIREYL